MSVSSWPTRRLVVPDPPSRRGQSASYGDRRGTERPTSACLLGHVSVFAHQCRGASFVTDQLVKEEDGGLARDGLQLLRFLKLGAQELLAARPTPAA